MCANEVAGGYLQVGKAATQNAGQTDNTKLDTALSLLVSFCAVHAHAAWLVYTLLLAVSLLVWHIAKVLIEDSAHRCMCSSPDTLSSLNNYNLLLWSDLFCF